MRCYICDAALSDEEVRFNHDHKDYDPCTVCKTAIADTVNDHGDTEIIVAEEELGPDTYTMREDFYTSD